MKMLMLRDEAAQEAHDWLQDNAAKIAHAHGERVFEEEKLKIILATCAKLSPAKSADAKKWDALTDPRYEAQAKVYAKACEAEREMTLTARAKETTINLYQTQSANQRGRM